MARRNSSTEAPATEARLDEAVEAPVTETEAPDEADTSAATEDAPVEASAEVPAETETKPAEVDLEPFKALVLSTKESMDASTGLPTEGDVTRVQEAYRELDGPKAKGDARKLVEELIHDHVRNTDMLGARCLMEIGEQMRAGAKSAKAPSAPKAPVDPTEAYVDRRTALLLATMSLPKPEGTADDADAKSDELYGELFAQVEPYVDYLKLDKEAREAADEPEAHAAVKAAAKLVVQGTGKVKAASTGGGTRSADTYSGPRRSIPNHIAEAFASQPSGAFLKVAEIAKYESDEYKAGPPPSQGAISSALKSGKSLPEGITGATRDGHFGAVKA